MAAARIAKMANARVVAVALVDMVQLLVPFVKDEAVRVEIAASVPAETHAQHRYARIDKIRRVLLQVVLPDGLGESGRDGERKKGLKHDEI